MANEMVPKSDAPLPGASHDAPLPVVSHDVPPAVVAPVDPPRRIVVVQFGPLQWRQEQRLPATTAPAEQAEPSKAQRTYRFFVYGLIALTVIFWGALSVPYGVGVFIALAFACCLFAWADFFADARKSD
jgi:hypothetical protein